MKEIYKRTKIWCSACDRSLVAPGTKCKECGIRNIDKSNYRDSLRSQLRKYLGTL